MSHESDPRQQMSRIVGLSSYAGGVVMLGLIVMAILEGDTDFGTLAIFCAAAFICFGLGYSTGRKNGNS